MSRWCGASMGIVLAMVMVMGCQGSSMKQKPPMTGSGVAFEHIGLNLRDPQAAAEWYCKNLGMTVVKNPPGQNVFFVADAGRHMMLELYSNPKSPVTDYELDRASLPAHHLCGRLPGGGPDETDRRRCTGRLARWRPAPRATRSPTSAIHGACPSSLSNAQNRCFQRPYPWLPVRPAGRLSWRGPGKDPTGPTIMGTESPSMAGV